jgi:hypothetical protein
LAYKLTAASPLSGLVHKNISNKNFLKFLLDNTFLKFLLDNTILKILLDNTIIQQGLVQQLVPVDPDAQIDPLLLDASLLEVFGSGTAPDE